MNWWSANHFRLLATRRGPVFGSIASICVQPFGPGGLRKSNGCLVAIMVMHM